MQSEGIREMRGIKTLSPAYCPVQILASTTLGHNRTTVNFVPLQSFGASMLRKSIIGAPILSAKVYEGSPEGLSEFRITVG